MRIPPLRSPSPPTPPPTYTAAQRMAALSAGRQDTPAAERMAQCDEAWGACFGAAWAWLRRMAHAWLN